MVESTAGSVAVVISVLSCFAVSLQEVKNRAEVIASVKIVLFILIFLKFYDFLIGISEPNTLQEGCQNLLK